MPTADLDLAAVGIQAVSDRVPAEFGEVDFWRVRKRHPPDIAPFQFVETRRNDALTGSALFRKVSEMLEPRLFVSTFGKIVIGSLPRR